MQSRDPVTVCSCLLYVRDFHSWELRWPILVCSEIQPPILFSQHICIPDVLVMCFTLLLLVRDGDGTPLQYSCLENHMDGGAWWAAVHGVGKSQTQLSDFTFTFHFHALEKEMATHSSVLAWRIPGMGDPGGLLSMGSHRVGHDWSNLAAAAEMISN